MNENSKKLLKLCSYYNLCITNTFFFTKPEGTPGQVTDMSLAWLWTEKQPWIVCFLYPASTVLTVIMNTLWWSARFTCSPRRSTIQSNPDDPASTLPRQSSVHSLLTLLDGPYQNNQTQVKSVEDRWSFIWYTVHCKTMSLFGRKERRNQDQFEANLSELEPTIKAKREALLNIKKDPSGKKNLGALCCTRGNAQRMTRCYTNYYWQNLCLNIQHCARSGNVWGDEGSLWALHQ